MKHNSHCIICKKPATAPRGNFNAKKPTLCRSVKCRHTRKMELQRDRRRQKELFDKSELQALTLPDDKANREVAPDLPLPTANTTSTAGNSPASGVRPSRERSRPRPARAAHRSERTSTRGAKKPARGKREQRA